MAGWKLNAAFWRTRLRLTSGLFDAAILDLGLPNADGAELCREARANGVDLPICMLTARTAMEDKLEGFRCGADDYVTKPFSMDELLARLSVMIFRGAARNPGRITVGELVLDLLGRSVLVGGTRLTFSRRKFDLLHFLARQAGKVVTRAQLLDEV